MIFNTTGQAAPGFWVLGSAQVPTYLFAGESPVLVDAGFACLGPWYQRDVEQTLAGQAPAYLLLTHAHFDHCGAVAWLKRAYPGLVVGASAKGAEIVRRPNALALIEHLSREAEAAARAWGLDPPAGASFAPFAVDMVLEDGQKVYLGNGKALTVLSTPGHTWDFLSYYEPEQGILVASEAVGSSTRGGQIFTEFLVDFEAYMESQRRLAALKPKVLAQGHRFVYTGQDALDYMERSQQAAWDFKSLVERLLDQNHGEVEKVIALVKAREYDPVTEPKQPEPAYLLNLTARVKHLAAVWAKAASPAPLPQ